MKIRLDKIFKMLYLICSSAILPSVYFISNGICVTLFYVILAISIIGINFAWFCVVDWVVDVTGLVIRLEKMSLWNRVNILKRNKCSCKKDR